MDVGSNHGLYSLFAAKLGADVITLEPQERLCRVINKAALLNGKEVAIIPLILSLLPLVYPLSLLVPSVRLPFLSEYRDDYYLNLLFVVRGCARCQCRSRNGLHSTMPRHLTTAKSSL